MCYTLPYVVEIPTARRLILQQGFIIRINMKISQTDSRKKAYRIGGDEFVMLIENPEKQEAEQIIQNVRDKLARHREEGGLRVSSATGTAEGNGIDILKIVHDADERMYEDKKRGKESREYAMFYSE